MKSTRVPSAGSSSARPPATVPRTVGSTSTAKVGPFSDDELRSRIAAQPVKDWSVPQVREWLHSCGLKEFENVFRRNTIGGAQLIRLGPSGILGLCEKRPEQALATLLQKEHTRLMKLEKEIVEGRRARLAAQEATPVLGSPLKQVAAIDIGSKAYSLAIQKTEEGPVVYVGSDMTVKVFDFQTLAVKKEIPGMTQFTYTLAIARNSALFAASHNSEVAVFDLASHKLVRKMTDHSHWVRHVLIHGDRIFTASVDASIKVYDLDTLKCTNTLVGHTNFVVNLAVWGDYLFSASYDFTVKVWDLKTMKLVGSMEGHESGVLCLATWGQYLISGCQDGTIFMWDLDKVMASILDPRPKTVGVVGGPVQTPGCVRIIKAHPKHCVQHLLVCGSNLYSCSDDKTIKVWDLATGACSQTLTGHTGSVCQLAVVCDYLLSAGSDNTVLIWQ